APSDAPRKLGVLVPWWFDPRFTRTAVRGWGGRVKPGHDDVYRGGITSLPRWGRLSRVALPAGAGPLASASSHDTDRIDHRFRLSGDAADCAAPSGAGDL